MKKINLKVLILIIALLSLPLAFVFDYITTGCVSSFVSGATSLCGEDGRRTMLYFVIGLPVLYLLAWGRLKNR